MTLWNLFQFHFRAPQWRAAHNSIFFSSQLNNFCLCELVSNPPQSLQPGHTIKELFRGDQKADRVMFTSIDALSLGRLALWRPAKLAQNTLKRQHISCVFFVFFHFYPNSLITKPYQPLPDDLFSHHHSNLWSHLPFCLPFLLFWKQTKHQGIPFAYNRSSKRAMRRLLNPIITWTELVNDHGSLSPSFSSYNERKWGNPTSEFSTTPRSSDTKWYL